MKALLAQRTSKAIHHLSVSDIINRPLSNICSSFVIHWNRYKYSTYRNTEEASPTRVWKVNFRETIITPRITYKIISSFSEMGEIKLYAFQVEENMNLTGHVLTVLQNQNAIEHTVSLRTYDYLKSTNPGLIHRATVKHSALLQMLRSLWEKCSSHRPNI